MHLKLLLLPCLLLYSRTEALPPDYASDEFAEVWHSISLDCQLELEEDLAENTTLHSYHSDATSTFDHVHFSTSEQLPSTTRQATTEDFLTKSTKPAKLSVSTTYADRKQTGTWTEGISSTNSGSFEYSTVMGPASSSEETTTAKKGTSVPSSTSPASPTPVKTSDHSTISESSPKVSSTTVVKDVSDTTEPIKEFSTTLKDGVSELSVANQRTTTETIPTFEQKTTDGGTSMRSSQQRDKQSITEETVRRTTDNTHSSTVAEVIKTTTEMQPTRQSSDIGTSEQMKIPTDNRFARTDVRSEKTSSPMEKEVKTVGNTETWVTIMEDDRIPTTKSRETTKNTKTETTPADYAQSTSPSVIKTSFDTTKRAKAKAPIASDPPTQPKETTTTTKSDISKKSRTIVTKASVSSSSPNTVQSSITTKSGKPGTTTTKSGSKRTRTTMTETKSSSTSQHTSPSTTTPRASKTTTERKTSKSHPSVKTKATHFTSKTMATKKNARSSKHSPTSAHGSTTMMDSSTSGTESTTIDPSCLLQCPEGWLYASGKCYVMITNGTKISYSLCLARCEAVGATLVGFYELTMPSVRRMLQQVASSTFNTSIVYSNAYKSNVLRVQNYLYTHNLSMDPQEIGSSWASKRIDQPKNHSIVNWCMKPVFCRPYKCPLFEIVHLSQGIYQTGHLNAMQEVEEGTVVKLKCVEVNADKPEWETACGKKGYWIPHPTYGECTRTWGLARTIVDRPGYTKIVEDCGYCHPVGTLRCEGKGRGYQCVCKALYEGHHCELTPRWCEQWPKSKDPCGNLGRCTEKLHSWYCKCHNENRTGTLCEFDRTANSFNPFGADVNVRHYFSPSMTSHISIGVFWFASWHIWSVLRIKEARRANDRVDWLHNLRYSALGVRSILVTMAGNPSIVDLDSPGRFCVWVALTWTSIAILYWHLAEAHSLLLLVRGVHLNSLRNVDGKPAMKLLMGYFVTPIFLMVLWFASVQESWDKLLSFPTHWSTLGSMEDPAFYEVCYMVAVLGGAIQITTIVITIMAEAERSGPNHALNRSMCCFHYWKPKRTEVMDKAFRSSLPNVICSLLMVAHTVASAYSFDRPDKKDFEMWTCLFGMSLSVVYFLHTRILCYSEVWAMVVELSMIYLPKKWCPRLQPLSLFTREEVLMKRAPHRLEKEKKEEEERKEAEWKAAVEADEAKRSNCLKRWPDCPPHLVPHVRLLGPDQIETDTTWPFSPSEKDYFCEEERHQVFMNLARAYFKDRLKRRHAPESSAFIAARELFGSQLHPRPCHLIEKQIKQFYKEFSELAEKDDWLLLGRDNQNMASFAKWDQMFYPGLEKLYRVFPHHDPRPQLYAAAMKLMEKSEKMWFYPYVDDLPTNIIIPTPYPLWTKWETFVEPFKISTEEQLNEAISNELASLEKHNNIWDCIYDNDDWIMALDEQTREKLRSEVEIKDGSVHENPRLLPIDRLNERMWDERRPGFIGPRRRQTRPTFNLWELSLKREYLEEEREQDWNALDRRSFRAHLEAGLTEERKNPRFVKFWVFNRQAPPPLHEQRIKFKPHIDRTPF